MPIPQSAYTDLWVAQDFLTRVVSRLFTQRRGDDADDIARRLADLLEAANQADPNSNDYLQNDAMRPAEEKARRLLRSFDVVGDENDER